MKYNSHFVVVIGSSHCRRAKSPLGTVLIINLLGKGLTPREMEAPFDGLPDDIHYSYLSYCGRATSCTQV